MSFSVRNAMTCLNQDIIQFERFQVVKELYERKCRDPTNETYVVDKLEITEAGSWESVRACKPL